MNSLVVFSLLHTFSFTLSTSSASDTLEHPSFGHKFFMKGGYHTRVLSAAFIAHARPTFGSEICHSL